MVTSRGHYIRWHDSATEVFLFVKKLAKTKFNLFYYDLILNPP